MKYMKKRNIISHCPRRLLLAGALALGAPQDSKPTLFLISNSHLDTQWNWDVKTTINDYVHKTMTENMALMDKYPAFALNYEGAIKYMWMKEYYPTEFEKLRSYVSSGRWHVSGMSVDANDVMVSSAESILHSMLYANRFYQQEFGVRGGYDIMLPDCFGFSYALPTLARHAGIRVSTPPNWHGVPPPTTVWRPSECGRGWTAAKFMPSTSPAPMTPMRSSTRT